MLQVDQPQLVELLEPLEERRVADFHIVLHRRVDLAGYQSFVPPAHLRDVPEQPAFCRVQRPHRAGKMHVARVLVGGADILAADRFPVGRLRAHDRPLHHVDTHPHVARLHGLLHDEVEHLCREDARV